MEARIPHDVAHVHRRGGDQRRERVGRGARRSKPVKNQKGDKEEDGSGRHTSNADGSGVGGKAGNVDRYSSATAIKKDRRNIYLF